MKYVNFLFLLVIIVSCNSRSGNDIEHSDSKKLEHSIFNLANIYSENERNISFPVLFNDSIIQLRSIRSIERRFYFSSSDTFHLSDEELAADKSFGYEFDENGLVKKLVVKNHYDFKTISGIGILYNKYQPKTGFAEVTFENMDQTSDFHFNRYSIEGVSKNLNTYTNVVDGSKLFIVSNPKHWKPLIIDTMCRPKKQDFIVWGTMKKPMKIYQVNNLVEESNVRKFNYEKGVLKSIEWTDDPFRIVRTIQYNKNGVCNLFIDSTFSMGGFVSTSRYDISLKNNLPIEVSKTLKSSSGDRVVFKERYIYSFFEEK